MCIIFVSSCCDCLEIIFGILFSPVVISKSSISFGVGSEFSLSNSVLILFDSLFVVPY